MHRYGYDVKKKLDSYIFILQFHLILSHKTYVSILDLLIVLVLCILSDCNFNDLLQPKCDINLHVQHLSYYKVCRISWPFSRTNIVIIKTQTFPRITLTIKSFIKHIQSKMMSDYSMVHASIHDVIVQRNSINISRSEMINGLLTEISLDLLATINNNKLDTTTVFRLSFKIS